MIRNCRRHRPTGYEVENVSRVLARIEDLRTQLGVSAVPAGFQQLLDARVSTGQEVSSSSIVGSNGPTTLGSMVAAGGVIPVALPSLPEVGIVDTAGLDSYLQTSGVRARNGHLRSEDLREASGGWDGVVRLVEPAAIAWEAMRRQAALDGVELTAIDSYRSWETQARAHDAYRAGEKPAYVAPPGRSEHGVGLAVDVTNGHLVGPGDSEWEWLSANADRFGWHPISNESWHWEFRGV